MFLPGIPFEPPRAGMIAMFCSVWDDCMGIDAWHITFVRVHLVPVSALEVYPP